MVKKFDQYITENNENDFIDIYKIECEWEVPLSYYHMTEEGAWNELRNYDWSEMGDNDTFEDLKEAHYISVETIKVKK